ncbi:MAG: SDR family oxidoreductase [Bacteroidota bacterium]|jgi:short-subunit dehydrogenase|nr:SDR family NAD(P)-dependent oxidoreductase [Cytophagales bacterium]MCE2959071.1 SDR family NAD(P)-dependent oxidoreductase [Flammeovirgaceae bacterium]MCZ8069058.1 SDR family NAD(P)-dependent oxidoreductase [Cytophagales bacterium]
MNKLIVVTGGTKGIGRAILNRFAQAGFDVTTCARKQQELTDLKQQLESAYGVKAFVKQADMSVIDQVKDFVKYVLAFQRPVDVLVNNAGYFVPGSVISEPEGSLESMINSNLYSAYYTSRGLASKMMEQREGHIFNICSIASIKAYPNGGSYAISKFAMLGLSKVLREELKEVGVRVTAVLPGATRTASWDGVDLPDERFMKVEDVAETIFAAHALSKRSVVEEILIRPQLGDI